LFGFFQTFYRRIYIKKEIIFLMMAMKINRKVIGMSIVLFCLTAGPVLSVESENQTPQLDLVFVIDTTGSMSDEIREVKMHIRNVINELINGTPRPDVRIGFVLYRDYPDQEKEYVYKLYPFTKDIDVVLEYIEEFQAYGGGDYEEVVTIGLDVAIHDLEWRVNDNKTPSMQFMYYDENQHPVYYITPVEFEGVLLKKMIFLIGDASPRTRPYDNSQEEYHPLPQYTENIDDAKEKDIIIFTISCSGMNAEGNAIWEEIAEQTNGRFEELTYERKNIQTYIDEEGLDESWAESVKSMSDYSPADASIMTNSLGGFVRSAVFEQAQSLGVKYNDTTPVNQTRVYINDLGYLFDENNNSIYDGFFCNVTHEITPILFENGTYSIDVDGDGLMDYTYSNAQGVASLQSISKNNPFLIAIIGIGGCIFLCGILGVIL
jgi:hypothetical protein